MNRILLVGLILGIWSQATTGIAQVVSVESRLVQDFQIAPGGRYTGTLTLVNTSDERADIVVYLNDYHRPAPGVIQFTEPNSALHDRSNVNWISLSDPIVQLNARERRDVRFSIQVPPETDLRHLDGTYWSSILVESLESKRRRDRPATGRGSNQFDMSMASSFRTAVLVTTNLPVTGAPAVSFLDVSVRPGDEGNTLTVDLRNDGRSAIGQSRIWIELYNSDGFQEAELTLENLQIMLPGNAYRRHVKLPTDEFRPGSYRVVVVLDSGNESMFGTQASIVLPPRPYSAVGGTR